MLKCPPRKREKKQKISVNPKENENQKRQKLVDSILKDWLTVQSGGPP